MFCCWNILLNSSRGFFMIELCKKKKNKINSCRFTWAVWKASLNIHLRLLLCRLPIPALWGTWFVFSLYLCALLLSSLSLYVSVKPETFCLLLSLVLFSEKRRVTFESKSLAHFTSPLPLFLSSPPSESCSLSAHLSTWWDTVCGVDLWSYALDSNSLCLGVLLFI